MAVTNASVFPSSFEYLPGGQELHSESLAAPVADEYLACGQLSQASFSEIRGNNNGKLEFGLPYFPAPQETQLVALIALSAYFPNPHSLHSSCP